MQSKQASSCHDAATRYGVQMAELNTSADAVASDLRPAFCEPSNGAAIVHLFRCLAAHEMLTHKDAYDHFLPGLEGLQQSTKKSSFDDTESGVPDVETVVNTLVLQEGVDAEHPMIQALAALLDVPLAVVYTSGVSVARVRLGLSA